MLLNKLHVFFALRAYWVTLFKFFSNLSEEVYFVQFSSRKYCEQNQTIYGRKQKFTP